MTAALIISIGSRGDTEPLIALSTKLLSHFQTVHILYQSDYSCLIPCNPRIVPHELPFNAEHFGPILARELPKSGIHNDTVKAQRRCISILINQLVVPAVPWFMRIAHEIDPSVVIATTLALSVAATIAEKRRVPLCLFNFQPNTPTQAYPYYMHGTEDAMLAADQVANMHQQSSPLPRKSAKYLETFNSQNELFTPSLPQLNIFRKSYGLEEMNVQHLKDIVTGRRSGVHVINTFCKRLIPDTIDHSNNVHIVPPLADGYIPKDWNADKTCPKVVKYLAKGEKPVCVTFGSVGGRISNASVTRELFSGLRAAGVTRVLILNGTTDLGTHNMRRNLDSDLMEWAATHVFVTTEKPQYAWLLPQCKALICHGGAGTVFAGLRAGIPVAVSPVLCDQFFWGRLLERLGLGAVAGPKMELATMYSFESAVRCVLDDKVLERVKRFAQVCTGIDGSRIAAGIVASLTRC